MHLIEFDAVDPKWRWVAEYSDIQVAVPEQQEQFQIASVITDTEIEMLQSRLDKAKAIKTGMMQQLLTGRIQLPVEDSA